MKEINGLSILIRRINVVQRGLMRLGKKMRVGALKNRAGAVDTLR